MAGRDDKTPWAPSTPSPIESCRATGFFAKCPFLFLKVFLPKRPAWETKCAKNTTNLLVRQVCFYRTVCTVKRVRLTSKTSNKKKPTNVHLKQLLIASCNVCFCDDDGRHFCSGEAMSSRSLYCWINWYLECCSKLWPCLILCHTARQRAQSIQK